jgi:hypothetical protein
VFARFDRARFGAIRNLGYWKVDDLPGWQSGSQLHGYCRNFIVAVIVNDARRTTAGRDQQYQQEGRTANALA